jgi:hypothetical protein
MPARGYKPPTATLAPPKSTEMAFREIDIKDPQDREWMEACVGIARHSSAEAWKNYRRIGEVRYALARSQRIAGYATLQAVRLDGTGKKVTKADSGVLADVVQSITSPFGGLRALIERFYLLRMVPGEGYLIRVRDKPGADARGYWFMSPSEISTTGFDTTTGLDDPIKWITAKKGNRSGSTQVHERAVVREDFLGRVWAPDGEYVDMCDSPMEGINGLCEQLHVLTEAVMNRLKSRLAMNGLLLIPQEMSDAAISAQVPLGTYSTNKVLNYFIHVMTHNLTIEAAGAKGAMPIAAMGPADVLEKLRWVIADFQVQETDLKLRAELIGRILDGLYQSKPQTQGNEGASHFQSWTNADEERRVTVQPDLDAFCDAMTNAVFRPALVDRGWEPGKIKGWVLGYDLSGAQVKSNQGEDTRQAWDRGWVGAEFGRSIIGAGEMDAMSEDEYIRWSGVKSGNPYLMCWGLDAVKAIDWTVVAGFGSRSGPDPKSEGDPEQAGPGTGQPGSPDDDKSHRPKSEKNK